MYTDLKNDEDGCGREDMVEKKETGVRNGAKVFVCSGEVREKHVFATKDETRLAHTEGRSGEVKEGGRDNGDGISVRDGFETVNDVDSFAVCFKFALGGLAVVRFEKDVGMFTDVCIIKEQASKAADVVENMIEKMGSESVKAGGVVQAQDGDCWLSDEAALVVECGEKL